MIFKIKLLNHFKLLWSNLLLLIFFYVVIVASNFSDDGLQYFLIIFLITILPILYLHIGYFIANKGQKITLFDSGFIYEKNGKSSTILWADVNSVDLYISGNMESGIPKLPFEVYHYVCVNNSNNNEKIIITCLMCPKLYKIVKEIHGVDIKIKRRVFCSIRRM